MQALISESCHELDVTAAVAGIAWLCGFAASEVRERIASRPALNIDIL
jgi:hypothetical protein